jgi:hypothetical protein
VNPEDGYDPFENYYNQSLSKYMGVYIGQGVECIFSVNNKDNSDCNYSFMYLIGYVISLFII